CEEIPAMTQLLKKVMEAFIVSILSLPLLSLVQEAGPIARAGSEEPPGLQRSENSNPTERALSLSDVKSRRSPDGKGRLWAVVIGVSSYKNLRTEEQLRFAHRDAEELAAFLRSPN